MKLLHLTVLLFALFTHLELKAQVHSSMDSIQMLTGEYKYDEALKMIDNALMTNNSSKDLYITKGSILRGLYNYESAVDSYLKALALDSTNHQVLIEIANTYKLQEDYKSALIFFNKAYINDTTSQYISLQRANCEMLDNQFEKAQSDFLTIYGKNKKNTYVIKKLAYLFSRTNQIEFSIQFYRQAIELNPLDFNSVLNLINQLIKNKDYQEAIAVSEDFQTHDPANKKINSTNAYLYLLDKQNDKAIEKFKECIESNDTTEFVYRNIGIAYFSIDSFAKAKTYLEKACAVSIKDVNTLHFLGIACYKSDFCELGVHYLEKAIEQYDPTQKELALLYQNMAEACRSWSKCSMDKKLAADLKAFEYNPDDMQLALYIALAYDKVVKNYAKAIDYYTIFVHSRPKSTPGTSPKQNTYTFYQNRIDELKAILKKN